MQARLISPQFNFSVNLTVSYMFCASLRFSPNRKNHNGQKSLNGVKVVQATIRVNFKIYLITLDIKFAEYSQFNLWNMYLFLYFVEMYKP